MLIQKLDCLNLFLSITKPYALVFLMTYTLLLLSVPSVSTAQQADESAKKASDKKLNQIELTRHLYQRCRSGECFGRFEDNGEFGISWSYTLEGEFQKGVAVFKCDETLAELDLVDDQLLKYSQAVKAWSDATDAIVETVTGNSTESDQGRLLKEYQEAGKKAIADIDSLLNPHQRKSLAQIQFRFMLRKYGISTFSHDLHLHEFLQLEKGALARWNGFSEEQRAEIYERIASARIEAVTSLLKQFSESDRDRILKKWPYLIAEKASHSERFRIHLTYEKAFQSLEKKPSVFERVLAFPNFELSPAGIFMPIEEDERYKRVSHFANWFDKRWDEPGFLASLDLTENQFTILDQIKAERHRIGKIASDAQRPTESGERRFDSEAYYRSQDLHKELINEFERQLPKLLSAEQIKICERMADKSLEFKYGPLRDLLEGDLGKELKMSDAAKDKLRAAAKAAVKEFETKTIDLEEFVLETWIANFPEHSQEKFRELFGPKLRETPANLSAYVN